MFITENKVFWFEKVSDLFFKNLKKWFSITEKSNLFYDKIKKGFSTVEKSNFFFIFFKIMK